MISLEKMYAFHKEGMLKLLTVDVAKSLKGKKIQILNFGYKKQDHTEEIVVGEILSELEYYRQLKEECYPDKNGFKNRAEEWESRMSAEQLKACKEKLVLVKPDGKSSCIFYDPREDYLGNNAFYMGDTDRPVWYTEVL